MTTLMLPVPQIRTHGLEATQWADYAIGKVATVLRQAPAPVRQIRLLVDSVALPQRIDAQVDLNGVTLRAHATGRSVREAADLVQERLRGQLRRLRRRSSVGPGR